MILFTCSNPLCTYIKAYIIYLYYITDSVRAFLKQKRQAQQATDEHDQSGLEEERLAAESITVGSRCEVTVPNAPPRRGLVMFVGNYSCQLYEQVFHCITQ